MDTEFMTTFAESLGAEGIRVLRFEFGYMAKKREDGRKRGPSGAKKLLIEWKEALEEAAQEVRRDVEDARWFESTPLEGLRGLRRGARGDRGEDEPGEDAAVHARRLRGRRR